MPRWPRVLLTPRPTATPRVVGIVPTARHANQESGQRRHGRSGGAAITAITATAAAITAATTAVATTAPVAATARTASTTSTATPTTVAAAIDSREGARSWLSREVDHVQPYPYP